MKRRFGGFSKLIRSLSVLAVVALPAAFGTDSVPHILRGHDTGGPGEFEFLPQGKLLEYWFGEDGIYQFHKDSSTCGEVAPVLSVIRRRWKMEDAKLKFGGEDQWLVFGEEREDGTRYAFEHTFTQEKAVLFFEALRRICGDSVLRGDGAAARQVRAAIHEKPGVLYEQILDEAGKWAHDTRVRTDQPIPRPPFHFLHTVTTEGFIEYEFLPEGKLVAYYDMELIPENRKFWDSRESFKVELLTWSKRADEIVVNHYGEGKEVLTITAGGKGAFSGRGMWKPVEHLFFIPRLLSFCDRPLPE